MDLDAAQCERGFACGGAGDLTALDRDADALAGLAPWADSARRLGAVVTMTLAVGRDPRPRPPPALLRLVEGRRSVGRASTGWDRVDEARLEGLCVLAEVDDGGGPRPVAACARPTVVDALWRSALRLGWRVRADGLGPWADVLEWSAPGRGRIVPRVLPAPTLPGEPVDDEAGP